MCVIICLNPGLMLPKEQLFNAVWNNPHSYGLIIKDGNGRLDLRKDAPKDADPELIFKLLEDNRDCKRVLHLRWATKGAKDISNAQPFEVYNSSKRRVFLAHNGTLNGFGNYKDEGDSDTKEFSVKVLERALLRWQGDGGKADYTDPAFHDLIIKPQWTNGSKGILISNDLDDLMFGPEYNGWTKYKGNAGIMVSNTDYFDEIKRGPEKERLDAVRREKEEEERKNRVPFQGNLNPTKNGGTNTAGAVKFCREYLSRDPKILTELEKMWEGHDLSTPEGLATLSYVTREELEEYVTLEKPDKLVQLIILLADAVDTLVKDKKKLEKNIERKQKKMNEILGGGKNLEETSDEDDDSIYVPVNVHTA